MTSESGFWRQAKKLKKVKDHFVVKREICFFWGAFSSFLLKCFFFGLFFIYALIFKIVTDFYNILMWK